MPHSHESHQFHRFGYTTIYGTCIRKSIQCKFILAQKTHKRQTDSAESVRENGRIKDLKHHMCTLYNFPNCRRQHKRGRRNGNYAIRYATLCHARKLKQLLFGSFISIPPHHQQYVDKYLHDIKCNQQQQ